MKNLKSLSISTFIGVFLSACGGVSQCDTQNIADQALNILLDDDKIAKKYGMYINNITLFDKEKNICTADINFKVMQRLEKDMKGFEEWTKEPNNPERRIQAAGVPVYGINSVILELLGIKNTLDYKNLKFIKPDGTTISQEELSQIATSNLTEWTYIQNLLNTFSNATMAFKVTQNNDGEEYIYAELK